MWAHGMHPNDGLFRRKKAFGKQLVCDSASVEGESVGWRGFEGGGYEAEGDTGKQWGETRPYVVLTGGLVPIRVMGERNCSQKNQRGTI